MLSRSRLQDPITWGTADYESNAVAEPPRERDLSFKRPMNALQAIQTLDKLPDPSKDPSERFKAVLTLSDAEYEVFLLLGEGLSVNEIAKRVYRSPKTIQSHIIAIWKKSGLSSSEAARSFAARFIERMGTPAIIGRRSANPRFSTSSTRS